MRIYGPNGTARASAAQAPRRANATGFAVTEEGATQAPASPATLRTIAGIDALLALQGIEDPAERRRRAVKHGFHALDALDELKLGLLAGSLDQSALLRLKAAAAALKAESGDARLDGVLAEIDLRAEVELAKAGIR
jgi:hypothetical protein